MQNNLLIAIVDGNGKIIASQPYMDFQKGSKSLSILNLYTGQKLFDILIDNGFIRYENNKFALKVILETNLNNVVMKLLGRVAEAVIVRNCYNDIDINQKWLSFARRKRAKLTTAEKFIAVGTGLLSTKELYPKVYNPSDPQRDVVWIDENTGARALMKNSSNIAGIEAGLQVKVSKNGVAYFLNDLVQIRYEVPVVYFDICNDFDAVAQKLYQSKYFMKTGGLIIGEDFIQASAVDYSAYTEVLFYVELIEALIYGKITPDELVHSKDVKNNPVLKSAILSASLSEIALPNHIYPQ